MFTSTETTSTAPAFINNTGSLDCFLGVKRNGAPVLTHFLTSFMELRAALTYRAPALTYRVPAITNAGPYYINADTINAYLSVFGLNTFPVVQNVMNALTYRAPALTYGAPATLGLPPAVVMLTTALIFFVVTVPVIGL